MYQSDRNSGPKPDSDYSCIAVRLVVLPQNCGQTRIYSTKMSQVTSPEIDGEVQTALPGLQGWVAARTLACTKPTDTQPTQLGHTTTGAGFTALVNG